jgi:hypothetical protein
MSLGGLIGAVMKPAAEAGAKYAEKRMDIDIKKELAAAESEMRLREDEVRRQRDIRDIPVKGAAETGVAVDRTTAVGQAQTGVDVAREDALRPGKVATTKSTALATGEAERENLAAYGRDAGARAGARAKAGDSESLASKMQARLAGLGIDEKQKIQALITEYENPSTSPERKAQIKDSLTVRGIIKPGEFDTEKVTTETTDDAGNVTKTERTQRRTSSTTPPKGTSGPKEGDEGTSKSGKPIVYRNGRWEYQ